MEANTNYHVLRFYLNSTKNTRSVIMIILLLLVEYTPVNHFWQRILIYIISTSHVCLSVCIAMR
jgi:hypothetical protein